MLCERNQDAIVHEHSTGGRAALRSLLIKSLALVLASAALGVFSNTVSSRGIPLLGPVPRPPVADGIRQIGLEEAHRLFDGRSSVFVDARSPEQFRKGHIPGAHLLTLDSFQESVSAFLDLIPEDTTLVTYCDSEGCGSSREVAELLVEEGYADIRLFAGGWDQWVQAGYPQEQGGAQSPAWFEDF